MDTNMYELSDGRKLGIKIFEVISFPIIDSFGKIQEESCQKLAAHFLQLITEIHRLCDSNTCIEFLWLTEKAHQQLFSSKIRIFSVLRKLGQSELHICNDLNNVQDNLMSTLSSLQFGVQEIDAKDSMFSNMLGLIDDSCVLAVAKREKCAANANSMYPYYFSDIVPNKNKSNFSSIISALSQHENCCISFQLFPVQLTKEELYLINEVSAELGHIATGKMINGELYRDFLATEPLKVYSYYNERNNSPMFLYNILAFGERANCKNLATKIISLLQCGDEKIITSDFACYDLSEEKIDLSKQFPHYVWNVNNRLLYYYRNSKLQNVVPLAKKLFRLPYIMSAEEVVSFFRLPLYEKNTPALKSNQTTQIQEQFDPEVVCEDNIKLGTLVSNENSKIVIGSPEKYFTRHALIVGTPGSGKTTFSINLLLQFVRKDIPFLAIEPTKTEYRAMLDVISNLQIFTPGNNLVSPFIINPFIPPKGIRIEQYIPSLTSAFKAAFSMPTPLDITFMKAIRQSYLRYGWKDYSKLGDNDVTIFGLHEFVLVFKELLGDTSYSNEVRGNLESAGVLRLTNLIEQNSNIYDTINTVSIEDLLSAPTVLELNAIDNAEQKSLIIALLLISICVYTKHNQVGEGKLKNVVLIDEAHVLLGGGENTKTDGSPSAQATTIKTLQDMIAEIRSYGTSIIIADQEPSKVSQSVLANTDIKVSFRLVESVDKELIANSTNMDEEAKSRLSRLKSGEAYVFYSKLDNPQMVVTEDIREKEGIRLSVSDAEIATRNTYWNERAENLKPYKECKLCPFCSHSCDFYIRSNAEFVASCAFEKYKKRVSNLEDLKKCIFHLPNLMCNEMSSFRGDDLRKLQICSRIKLIRKFELETSVSLNLEDKKKVITRFPKGSERGEINV